ncbi:acid protease [Dentipellis sp. KUC8613]|nr:acid protease [Dentipellis sp. KUC8613]
MLSLVPLSLLLLLDIHSAFAVRVPVQGFPTTTLDTRSQALHRRAQVAGIPIRNSQNVQYIGNITLGGAPFPVVLDTGSSDLWVAGNVPNTQDAGKKAIQLSYAIGQAKGVINYASLGFDNFTVDKQAYVLVTDTSTFSTNIQAQGYSGLIGLGPNSGSVIYQKIDDHSADNPLFRIFGEDKTTQNYISVLLDRQGDPTESYTGQFTISELVPGFENITSQPKLTVKDVPTLTDADQHWAVLTDQDGVIGPDGEVMQIDSIVPRVPDKKLVAVLDSGFSFPQVPREMSDAIYGRVQGAVYNTKMEIWTIPCDQELNITFIFGGVKFPMHPLDMSLPGFDVGTNMCVGTFQPITSAFSLLGEYDVILGMAFLRNAYALIDFGNFVPGTSDTSDPFVQMLPLTDLTSAHSDFVQARLNGQDTTGSASKTLLPASQQSHSPQTAAEKKQHDEGAILRKWPYILIGCLAFVIILFGLCIWGCCTRRRRNRLKHQEALAGAGVKGGGPYHTLGDAVPAMSMQNLGQGHAPPPPYGDPFARAPSPMDRV